MIATMPERQPTPHPVMYHPFPTCRGDAHGNLRGGATTRADNVRLGRDLPDFGGS